MRFPELTFFVGDLLDDNPIVKFAPDVLVLAEITWYVLESLPSFKRLLIDKCGGSAILHILTVYPLGQQRYGKEYFTNLDEIMKFWSDTVEMKEWGWVSREGADGTGRTFFYGTIREPGI